MDEVELIFGYPGLTEDAEPTRMTHVLLPLLRASRPLCVVQRYASLPALVFPSRRRRCAEPQDRQVAEWVLLMGGSVRLEGRAERIREVTQLPAADFQLELVDLVGTNILPPDLKWLTGLTRLKILNLPGPMWNPSSGATIDYSRDLRHIANSSRTRRADVQLHLSRIDQVRRYGDRRDRGARRRRCGC